MKKTISVHIGGRVFSIEEDAYDKLNAYLNAIRTYFSNQDSADEIIADIELRLAELFLGRLGTHREVVTLVDVHEVIEVMGRPEDFADSDDEGADGHSESSKKQTTSKRVFRDPDNKVIFGVCGGISAYFGWDPIILRILFALMFIVYGWGLLLYILLAIIIPKAKTTAEKLQMRGEPVTVENISKKVSQSFEGVKEDLKEFGKKNDFNEERIKGTGKRVGDFFAQLGEGILRVLKVLVIIFGKLIGVIFVFAAIIAILIIIGLIFGWDMAFKISDGNVFLDDHFEHWANALFAEPGQRRLFFWAAAGSLILPLIGLLLLGLRLVLDMRKFPAYVGLSLTVLWITSIIALSYVGVTLYRSFHVKASYTEHLGVLPTSSDTLVVDAKDLGEPQYSFRTGYGAGRAFFHGIVTFPGVDSTQLLYIERNRLTIAMNETSDQFELEVRRSARGSSQKEAIKHAGYISADHAFAQDSLHIYPWFALEKGEKIRGQRATYTLRVPVGKRVHLTQSSKTVLHDIPNITNTLDRDMVGHTWVMTHNGLACETCLTDRPSSVKSEGKVPIEIERTE